MERKKHKVLLLGRKDLGAKCLLKMERDYPDQFQVPIISSNPGTDVWWGSNRLAESAWKRGIVFIPDNRKNEDVLYSAVKSLGVDLIISVQYRWILSKRILDAVGGQAYNLHAAKLPDYKGYNSVNHALLNGEKEYTVTIHRMAEDVDSGGILLEESFPILETDVAKAVYEKSMSASEAILFKLIDVLAKGELLKEKLIEGEGNFYGKTDIDSLREVTNEDDVMCRARAFYFPPFEPAYYCRNGKKIYLIPEEELLWKIRK